MKLTTRDDINQGEHQMLLAHKAKEIDDMRRENLMVT